MISGGAPGKTSPRESSDAPDDVARRTSVRYAEAVTAPNGHAHPATSAATLRPAMAADSGGQSDAPRGWYLAADAAQLVGVSAWTIGQWARFEYIRATRDPGPPEVFAYQDVAEAMAVRELLRRGVPRQALKTTIDNCRDVYGNWPLTTAPLSLPLRAAVPILERPDADYDIGKGVGNQAILQIEELEELITLLNRGGWVIRDHPEIVHIEVDPDVLSGRPVIRGHRIPAVQVAEIAKERGGRRELRAAYDLTPAEITDAVKWWDAITETQKAA
jgi:uncharacterized protein (DUF433 family)